jgi:hypothetical protein
MTDKHPEAGRSNPATGAVGSLVDQGVGRLEPERADAKPRKWFVNLYAAKITLRKVNKWDEFHAKHGAAHFFDTWEEAHAHLTAKASERLKKAKAELPAAQRNIQRVGNLKTPNVRGNRQP